MFRKINNDPKFAIPPRNLTYIIAGLALMVLGYILMIGGGTHDPDIFTGEKMFSFRRIVLAPILIIAGVVLEIYAIMKKDRK